MRLGVMGNWAHPYLTMDFQTEAETVRALGESDLAGDLRSRRKAGAVPDSLRGSSLAEAEVEYKDKISPAVDVAYRFKTTPRWLAAFGFSQNRRRSLCRNLDHHAVERCLRAKPSAPVPMWFTN